MVPWYPGTMVHPPTYPGDPYTTPPRDPPRVPGSLSAPVPQRLTARKQPDSDPFSGFSWLFRAAPQRKRRVFSGFCRKRLILDQTKQRVIGSGRAGFRAWTCPETRIPGIPDRTDPRGRLAPPESARIREMAGFCRKRGVSRVALSGRVWPAVSAGRVEIATFGTSREVPKAGSLSVSFYLKACFVKSEIEACRNHQIPAFWMFRRA